jgi:cyclopropane-fatty-acyl-phospholipid synthase
MLADMVADVLPSKLPVLVRMPDGSTAGPPDSPVTVVVHSERAIRRVLAAPGELGLARAYVSGDLDVEGDLVQALHIVSKHFGDRHLDARRLLAFIRLFRHYGIRPVPPPPEEVELTGRLHSPARDAAAIAYHYDISNEFYELLLGPSMCYSCAVWSEPGIGLSRAQELKWDLVCQKLDLRPGLRLLDAGCGWGSMAIYAARNYGVEVTAVTLSSTQAEYACAAIEQESLGDVIEVRHQDYRAVNDGPYDATCAIGMLEHIGSDLSTYAAKMYDLLAPGGRFLHHAISRVIPTRGPRRRTFISRYVFPDAALHEIGHVISAFHRAGLEVRHAESLRDHYPHTLRAWLNRLESEWPRAVALVGAPRARIWRLYIAAGLLAFEANSNQIHQVLAVKPDGGRSPMSLIPGDWSTVASHDRSDNTRVDPSC